MILFEIIESTNFFNSIEKALKINAFFLVMLVFLFYIFSNSHYAISIIPLVVIISLLISGKKILKCELGLIYILFTFIYILIPTIFIVLLDEDYTFGTSILNYPNDIQSYYETINYSIFYLLFLWVSMYYGVIYGSKKKYKDYKFKLDLNLNYLNLLGLFIIITHFYDIQSFYQIRLGESYNINYLSQIFNDHAYLLLITLFIVTNKSVENNLKLKYLNQTFIIFTIFYTITGSKSGLLVATFLLVVYQLSLSNYLNSHYIYFFKKKYLIILSVLLPIFFILGKIFRILFQFDFNDITFEHISYELTGSFFSIIYRLLQGGFDQYLAIFNIFILNDYDFEYSILFITYIAKNTINLLLPGTIYPEAFTMTSQLFPDVLNKSDLISTYSIETLILKLNTQPYTIFGLFCILFGVLSPFFLFIFTFIFSRFVSLINSPMLKIIFIYFFGALLSCFGLDVVIGNTFLIFVSLSLMLAFLKN